MEQREIAAGPQLIIYPNRRMMRRYSLVLTGVAVFWGIMAVFGFFSLSIVGWLLFVIAALFCALMAGYCRRLFLSDKASMVLDSQGIRLSGRMGAAHALAWSDIEKIATSGADRQKLSFYIKPTTHPRRRNRARTFSLSSDYLNQPAREVLEQVQALYGQQLQQNNIRLLF